MTEYFLPLEFSEEDGGPDWLEITIMAPGRFFSWLENFFHLHARPVVIHYFNQGYSLNQRETFIARIPCSLDLDDILKKLDTCLAIFEGKQGLDTSIDIETQFIRDGKDSFGSFQVSPHFWVVPAWEDTSLPDERLIRLNPGRAFGTGRHPSTLLCLQALEEIGINGFFNHNPIVLDIGTGTGILSIAAAKLGSKMVLALEVDREAAKTAQKNVSRNNLTDRIEISLTPLPEVQGSFNLVLANLTAAVALYLADDICPRLAQGGFLILSGLKARQIEILLTSYTAKGLKMIKLYRNKSWSACLFTR